MSTTLDHERFDRGAPALAGGGAAAENALQPARPGGRLVIAPQEVQPRCVGTVGDQQCEMSLRHGGPCVVTCREPCSDEFVCSKGSDCPGCIECNDEFDAIPRIHARAKGAKTFDELVSLARELPEMAEEQRIEQAIEWGWFEVSGPGYENPNVKAIFAAAAWRRQFVKTHAGLESFKSENTQQRTTISELRKTVAEYRDLHFKEQNEIEALKRELTAVASWSAATRERDEVQHISTARRVGSL